MSRPIYVNLILDFTSSFIHNATPTAYTHKYQMFAKKKEKIMPIIDWTDDYSININEIDDQHKRLLQLINGFYDALQGGIGQEAMPFLLNELIDYTKTHFSKEEELMKENQFPEYETHKAEHDNLAKEVLDIRKRHDDGDKSAASKLSLLMSSWLTDHIATKNKKIGEYLNSN